MPTAVSEAMDEARAAVVGGPSDRFLEGLAERIGARASVQAVFGDPVERGEVTVIPVARVRWGVGGGAGTSAAAAPDGGTGSGGGGGATADPVGYLEIGPEGATFRAIAAAYPSPAFILAGSIGAAIIFRALARLIRG